MRISDWSSDCALPIYHDMFDEVGDVAVEEVDAENAPAAQAALIADVDAPSLFVAEFRITAGAILVARRLIFFDGGDEIVIWTAHRPGEGYPELVFVRWRIAEVERGVEVLVLVRASDGLLVTAYAFDVTIGDFVAQT